MHFSNDSLHAALNVYGTPIAVTDTHEEYALVHSLAQSWSALLMSTSLMLAVHPGNTINNEANTKHPTADFRIMLNIVTPL